MAKQEPRRITDEDIDKILDIIRIAEALAPRVGQSVTDVAWIIMKASQMKQTTDSGTTTEFMSLFKKESKNG